MTQQTQWEIPKEAEYTVFKTTNDGVWFCSRIDIKSLIKNAHTAWIEETIKKVEGMKKNITDGMFNAAINSGRGTGSISEVHYNDACDDIIKAIKEGNEV